MTSTVTSSYIQQVTMNFLFQVWRGSREKQETYYTWSEGISTRTEEELQQAERESPSYDWTQDSRVVQNSSKDSKWSKVCVTSVIHSFSNIVSISIIQATALSDVLSKQCLLNESGRTVEECLNLSWTASLWSFTMNNNVFILPLLLFIAHLRHFISKVYTGIREQPVMPWVYHYTYALCKSLVKCAVVPFMPNCTLMRISITVAVGPVLC